MMATVFVSYHFEGGWSLIDAAAYANPLPDGPATYCVRQVSLNDGDTLNLRATFERPLSTGQQIGLTARAERWLIDAGYTRKVGGRLHIDWKAIGAISGGGR